MDDILIVFVTDVLDDFRAGLKRRMTEQGERLGVRPRIVNGDFEFQVPEVGPPKALDHVQLFGMGVTAKSNQNLSLNPTVSTTSVSPSHLPIESPYQVGLRSFGWARPSMKICR